MNYYFTDYEELEALRKENAKLKVENSKLMDLSASFAKESGKANRKAKEQLEKVVKFLKDEIDHVKALLDPTEQDVYKELLGVGRGYQLTLDFINSIINGGINAN